MFPFAFVALSLSAALAGDAVKLEVVRKGQQGQSNPALVLVPQVGVQGMNVRVDCGGAWVEHKGGAKAGQRINLEFAPQTGHHTCSGKLHATFDDGSTADMPLSFEVDMYDPLKITVPKDKLDTSARHMQVVLDRVASRVDVVVYGVGGKKLGEGTALVNGQAAGTPVEVEWSSSPGEVLKMEVKGTDADGFWSTLELSPWYYEIPHEDVVFESAKDVIRETEAPKLSSAKTEVDKTLARYGAEATIKLFVGGYTDTVGDKTSNLFLSEKRAAAIAHWFKNSGFSGEIWVQGFGERGLAVATPDEVDELRNRRAVYILAAEPPPPSSLIPASAWKRLQ